MDNKTPTRSGGTPDLPPDVDETHLKAFVRRANAGAYENNERETEAIDGLSAAVAVIETVLAETPTAASEPATTPPEAKWAAAAGYEDGASDGC
ncbi:hypothetical protein HKK80_00380 [Halonotius sp. F2-221B]|uniref:hypothetical protein n=1 Tax=Halonotius sp. F2-221B TaxID=2731620 RepID=UPI00398AC6BB